MGESAMDAKARELALESESYSRLLCKTGDSCTIKASEDIQDSYGRILITSGTVFKTGTTEKIVKHKLLKPIEESVSIAEMIDGEDLITFFDQFMAETPELLKLKEISKFHYSWREHCVLTNDYPLLQQKLTVMRQNLPKMFGTAVVSSWFCAEIAGRLQLSRKQQFDACLSGLINDIGMLHIDPKLYQHGSKLTNEEWRALQGHTVVSQKIAERCYGVSQDVCLAVLQHHERFDGTGYPRGDYGEQLGQMGQIVALTDTFNAMYRNTYLPKGRGLRDMLPPLKVMAGGYRPEVHQALIQFLNEADIGNRSALKVSAAAEFSQRLISKQRQMIATHKVFSELLDYLKIQAAKSSLVEKVSLAFEHLTDTLNRAGLLDTHCLSWLLEPGLELTNDDCREIEDLSLMISEIGWQLIQFRRLLETAKAKQQFNEATLQVLNDCLERISKI